MSLQEVVRIALARSRVTSTVASSATARSLLSLARASLARAEAEEERSAIKLGRRRAAAASAQRRAASARASNTPLANGSLAHLCRTRRLLTLPAGPSLSGALRVA